MKPRILVAVAAILAFAAAGSLSSVGAAPQQESPQPPHKGKGFEPAPTPSNPKLEAKAGELGELEEGTGTENMSVVMQVDSMMQRMKVLMNRAQSYSKSFAVLAENHQGADRSEILMMQQMSESMGTMAGEIKMSLEQYKKMLEDETNSESGNVKAEVRSFKDILDGIEGYINRALGTLQALQERLGQG